MQALGVKEAVLRKVEQNITAERSDWERKMENERAEFETALALDKEKSTNRVRQVRAEAKAKIVKMSQTLHSTQKEAANDLDARARQLESLHSQLQKLQQKLKADKVHFDSTQQTEKSSLDARERLLGEREIATEVLAKEEQSLRRRCSTAVAEKEEALERVEIITQERESLRVETLNLEMRLGATEHAIKKFQSIAQECESLHREKKSLQERLGENELTLESLQKRLGEKDSALEVLQERLGEGELTLENLQKRLGEKYSALEGLQERLEAKELALESLEATVQECKALRVEKHSLQKRLAHIESESQNFDVQKEAILRRDQEFDLEREHFMERVRAVQESERRLVNLEKKEEDLKNEYEALSQLKNLVEEEKQDSSEKANELAQLENELRLQRETLEKFSDECSQEKAEVEEERICLEDRTKKLQRLEHELKSKLSNVAVSEKKLKDYAQLMKKQSKEIKVKEKSLQNVAKLLNEKRGEALNKDSDLISDLQQMLDEEQRRYQDLLEKYERQGAELFKETSNLDQLQSDEQVEGMEDRIHQMAVLIKEKDEDLTRKLLILEDKLAKCDECEARLGAWQKELESIAAALNDSDGE